ncbi:MAG TPA: hypothetical protein VNN12_04810, partial [Dehalococcoidia bacterium]|nr:hypothetical protein [Dehalococcoidia bacterium]
MFDRLVPRRSAGARCRAGRARPLHAEPLEPRTLLAAIGGVGLFVDYDSSGPGEFTGIDVQFFGMTGELTGDRVAGSLFYAGETGSVEEEISDDVRLRRSGHGRLMPRFDDGSGASLWLGTGGNFLSTDGYPLGWALAGEHEDDPPADSFIQFEQWEFVTLFDLAQDASVSSLAGQWSALYARATLTTWDVTNEPTWNFQFANGTAVFAGSSIIGNLPMNDSSGALSVNVAISALNADGTMTLVGDRIGYLAADLGTFVFVDQNAGDGVLDIAVFSRFQSAPSLASAAGTYRVGLLGVEGEGFVPVGFTGIFLLHEDGTLESADLFDFDAGFGFDEAATWSTSVDRVRLEFEGFELRGTVGNDAASLLLSGMIGDVPVLAVATRTVPADAEVADPISSVPLLDPDDAPLVFERDENGTWRWYDLSEDTSGPDAVAQVVSWVDPKDGRHYVAALKDGDVFLYKHETDDTWEVRNLTTETGATESIAGGLCSMIDALNSLVLIIGITDEGDIFAYVQTGGKNAQGEYAYFQYNISEFELRPNGEHEPEFVGELITYTPSWGAVHIAGLDAAGDIWSVWWAPGVEHWHSNNLSDDTGAAPIVGGLSAYLTSWDAINLVGIDAAGNLQVTWWLPSFGGDWAHNNLTA